MKYTHCIALAVLLIAPAILIATYVREFIAVDSALDAGASYNYREGRADFSQNNQYIPFSKRHRLLVTISGWSTIGVIAYPMAFVIWKKKAAKGS